MNIPILDTEAGTGWFANNPASLPGRTVTMTSERGANPRTDQLERQKQFGQKMLARIVGIIALLFPFAIFAGGMISEVFFPTISDSYYGVVIVGDIFVGTLCFIGVLLFAYRGWNRAVSVFASAVGLFGLAIAFFPTDGWERMCSADGCLASTLHFTGAFGFFAGLAIFCFVVFTCIESHHKKDGRILPGKRNRNRIYRLCGFIIVLMMIAIGVVFLCYPEIADTTNLVFILEGIALVAFGIAWCVQGLFLIPKSWWDDWCVAEAETLHI